MVIHSCLDLTKLSFRMQFKIYDKLLLEFMVLPILSQSGWRRLMEVCNVTPGTVSSCVDTLKNGHILGIAPGMLLLFPV